MTTILGALGPLLIFLVFIALCLGLWTMLKGYNPNLSQKFMRWRVILQFAAIIVLALTIYLKKRYG